MPNGAAIVTTLFVCAITTLTAAATTPSASSTPPSFLFILGDDIGWADFRYNNGTAASPRLTEWTRAPGTVVMHDFHSGGTVCSPTRASVLTGRNHFRDCVNYVFGCSDMTECVPHFEFAPRRTFTIADAVRASGQNYTSFFGGKWHLGSFYNDSERHGGLTSSPLSHGFDRMNATVEVAPTATTNCECRAAWMEGCDYGHYGKMTHCGGGPGPDPAAGDGCCFNYWWEDATAPHGVSNLSRPTPDDDATYLADAFVRFAEAQRGAPFLAQLSFHNCHIPFVGTAPRRAECVANASCAPPLPGAPPYNDQELDFYACLNELDAAVGAGLDSLKRLGYYEDTMVWLTTDNGPEVNCPPEGRCGSKPGGSGHIPPGTLHRPQCGGAGCAGTLRGRKRDVWEGGHRVPGIVSWPAVARGPARASWDTVVTMDFLATILDVLGVARPAAQSEWHFDGVSVLPILKGETPPPRGIGWMYHDPTYSAKNGYAYRRGRWKYVVGGISCDPAQASFDCHAKASFDCHAPQLYDMETDYAEEHDLASAHPSLLAALAGNFTAWYETIWDSRANESHCAGDELAISALPSTSALPSSSSSSSASATLTAATAAPSVGTLPEPSRPTPFPPRPVAAAPRGACSFAQDSAIARAPSASASASSAASSLVTASAVVSLAVGSVASREQCCGACVATPRCVAAEYAAASPMRPTFEGLTSGGTCELLTTTMTTTTTVRSGGGGGPVALRDPAPRRGHTAIVPASAVEIA